MDSILSLYNKIFTWDGEKLVKSLRAIAYRQLDGIWDGMWGFIMESPHFNTSHRSETTGIAERAVRRLKRRHFSSIATIRTGWKVVVRFFGMLLPSAKHLRPPRRWENTVWKTIWRIIQKTIIRLEHWLNLIRFLPKIKQEFISLARKHYQESFLAIRWSRAEFGKEIFWWQTWKWKIWKSSTHLIFILEESTRKRSWSDKKMTNSYSHL